MKRKLIHMVLPVLAVVMLFCVRTQKVSAAVIVQSGSCGADDGSNITWTLDDEGCLTLDGTGRTKDYRETINGQDTLIDKPWKEYRKYIKSVVIKDGITYIGKDIFDDLSNLVSVDCGNTLETIGTFAFWSSPNLTDINLGNVKRISQGAFQSCASIKNVYIPGSMRVVEFDAFSYDEALESVYIDKASDASIPFLSVSPIAFKYCNSLKEVNVNPERTDLISIDGVLYSINRENELAYTANNMYTMTEGNYVLIYYPSGKTDKEYIAPDKLELIGGYNISNKYLEKIVLNEGLRVTSSAQLRETAYLYSGFMDEASYEFANLKELIIPSTVIEADCKFETDGIDKAVNKSNVDVKMECRNSTVVCNRKFVSLTTGQESDVIKAGDTYTTLKHQYGEWYIVWEPTEYHEGEKAHKCNVCGYEERVSIPSTSDSAKNGLYMDDAGNWYYYKDGVVENDYTGLASNEYGWFYVSDGAIDWSYTGLASNEYGWFYVTGGVLDWNYTGLADNEYGWFYVTGGVLDWSYTGLANNEYGWFYVTGGVLDWSYTGLASNEYGWFYVTGGVLDWNYTGLANNEYGWFYISNGVLDWNYTGTASNEYGTWNVVNGQVVF